MFVKDFLCPRVARSMQEDSSDLQSIGIQFRNFLLTSGTFVDVFISGAFFFWSVILAGFLGANWKDLSFYTLVSAILLFPTIISFIQYPKQRIKMTVSGSVSLFILILLIALICFPGVFS